MKGSKNNSKKIFAFIFACVMVLSLVTVSFAVFNNGSKASTNVESTVDLNVDSQNIDNKESDNADEEVYRDIELSESDKEIYSDLSPEEVINEEELELEETEPQDDIQQEENNFINPKEVRFMQSSIKNQTGEYTVIGNAEALKNGTLKATDLALIRLWKDDSGQLWTLDHRRLAAFRLAGLESVPFQWATEEEVANQMWKMTTKTNGETIRLKLGKGENMIVQ